MDNTHNRQQIYSYNPHQLYVSSDDVQNQGETEDKEPNCRFRDVFKSWEKNVLLTSEVELTDFSGTRNKNGPMVQHIEPYYIAASFTLPASSPNFPDEEYQNPVLLLNKHREEMVEVQEKLRKRVLLSKPGRLKNYKQKILNLQILVNNKLSPLQSDDSESDSNDEAEIAKSKEANPVAVVLSNSKLSEEYIDQCCTDLYKDKRLFSDDLTFPIVPSQYLGGCLKSVKAIEADGFITALVSGSGMSQLVLKHTRADGNSVLFEDEVRQNLKRPIKQVEIQSYDDSYLAAARCRKNIQIFSYDGHDEISRVSAVKDRDVDNMALNPWYKELVYSWKNQVNIWNDDDSVTTVCSDWEPRFDVDQDIKTVHYGSTPRCIVMTDPSVCTMLDIRTKQSTLPLFEVPSNKLLELEERLVTSVSAPDPGYYHILAQKSLLTIDERFTKSPVHYMTLPVLTWPMYMDIKRLEGYRDILLYACPSNSEVFAMVTENQNVAYRSTPVWKCSQIDDMLLYPKTKPELKDLGVIEGKLRSGVLGVVSTCVTPDRFTVLMLNGEGDLFEQTYLRSDDITSVEEDFIKCGGLSEEPIEVPDSSIEKCVSWYSEVAAGSLDYDEEEDIVYDDLCEFFDAKPNKHCPICVPGPKKKKLSKEQICPGCEVSIGEARKFYKAITNHDDYYYVAPCHLSKEEPDGFQEMVEDLNNFKTVDANTELLIKLWEGEDFSSQLIQRDKLWEEWRQKDDESTVRSSEFDIASISQAGKTRSQHSKRTEISSVSGARSVSTAASSGKHTIQSAGDEIFNTDENFGLVRSVIPASQLQLSQSQSLSLSQTFSQSLSQSSKKKGKQTKGF